MNIAVILASGKGTRMNNSTPKQYIRVGGMPLIVRVLNQFVPLVDKIILVVNKDYVKEAQNIIKDYKNIELVLGGETRFQSLINGTKRAYEIDKNCVVISHDGARPFVSKQIINSSLEEIEKYDATTVSIPAIDTMVIVENNIETKVLDREYLYSDQGPQTFRAEMFFNVLDNENYSTVGELYVKKGLKVGVIEGDRYNFKVTHNIDLEFAEYLIEKGLI